MAEGLQGGAASTRADEAQRDQSEQRGQADQRQLAEQRDQSEQRQRAEQRGQSATAQARRTVAEYVPAAATAAVPPTTAAAPFVAAAAMRAGNQGASVMAASPGEITQTQTSIATMPDGTTATTVVTTTTVTTTTTTTTTTTSFVTGEMRPIEAHQLEASASLAAASVAAATAAPAAIPVVSAPPVAKPMRPRAERANAAAAPAVTATPATATTAESATGAPSHAKATYAKPLSYRFTKRLFDIVFSALVVVVGFIPGLILSLAIVASTKGSPFYVQKRVKKGGQEFSIYKFRTMVADADNLEKYLSPEQLAEWHAEHKVENDPRITRLGSFLRKTSIDEFPNFLNVLAGQMSIVGPRAITEEELDWFGTDRAKLLSVPAGVTGWWQVSSRNDATFESGERQKLEMYYVDHASLGLDIRIFFKTFAAVFQKTGQ